MITTERVELVCSKERFLTAKRIRSHGINYLASDHQIKKQAWYYEQSELGYNYRMTEMQAALGIVQMSRLEFFVKEEMNNQRLHEKIGELATKVSASIEKLSVQLPPLHVTDSGQRYDRDDLYMFLKLNKIASQVHYIPVYRQPFYRSLGFSENYCEHTERYFNSCLSIPLHQKLEEDDFNYVVDKLFEFFT